MTLEVMALEAMPVSCGWHPWFRRRLDGGDPARVLLDAAFMLARDGEGIATRARVPPPPAPWDDCFGGTGPVVIEWPDLLRLRIESTCDWVVVYDEREDAVCVEPQTAPPDDLNHDPDIAEPGRPLVAATTWTWEE
jgi:aldose 1-epimerase